MEINLEKYRNDPAVRGYLDGKRFVDDADDINFIGSEETPEIQVGSEEEEQAKLISRISAEVIQSLKKTKK